MTGPVHCAASFSELFVYTGRSSLTLCGDDPVNVSYYRINVTCPRCLVLMDEHDSDGLWYREPS